MRAVSSESACPASKTTVQCVVWNGAPPSCSVPGIGFVAIRTVPDGTPVYDKKLNTQCGRALGDDRRARTRAGVQRPSRSEVRVTGQGTGYNGRRLRWRWEREIPVLHLMNLAGERQHYVSRVLLERFKIRENPLQCYQVASGEWKPKGLDTACSGGGYNQLISATGTDNSLEEAFSKVETRLPRTLSTLERAARKKKITELPAPIFDNLCRYCAFLKLSSLASKASAVVNFVYQLNFEVEIGQRHLLRELQIPEATITAWKTELASGRRIIIDAENPLQLLYRLQFRRVFGGDYGIFSYTKWAICESPLDLPMSDIGLVPMQLEADKAMHYILPIGPRLVLGGIFFHDLTKNSRRQPLRSMTLTNDEAQYYFDSICASAVTEIVCSSKIPEIANAFDRAEARGIRFLKIVSAREVTLAGLKDSPSEIQFRSVSMPDFVKFVHSFIRPRNNSLNAE